MNRNPFEFSTINQFRESHEGFSRRSEKRVRNPSLDLLWHHNILSPFVLDVMTIDDKELSRKKRTIWVEGFPSSLVVIGAEHKL